MEILLTNEGFLADCTPYRTVKCIISEPANKFISKPFGSLLCIKQDKSDPYLSH